MGDSPAEPELLKPWWASLGFWLFMGSFVGTMSFSWVYRAPLLKAYRTYMPDAKLVGKGLAREAKELAKGYLSEEETAYAAPDQPANLNLSAPVDPSQGFGKTLKVKTSARSRRMMRKVRGRKRQAASEVREVRQYMNAHEVSLEAELGFWQTDLGIGIKLSLGMSFIFFVVGYLLFQRPSNKARTFT